MTIQRYDIGTDEFIELTKEYWRLTDSRANMGGMLANCMEKLYRVYRQAIVEERYILSPEDMLRLALQESIKDGQKPKAP